jgi:hypothetical protein
MFCLLSKIELAPQLLKLGLFLFRECRSLASIVQAIHTVQIILVIKIPSSLFEW